MMKKLEVGATIKESAAELLQAERSEVHGMLRDKVRFLRLLKQNPELPIEVAAQQAGNYKKSWGYGVFACYRKLGLSALCTYKLKGKGCRLNAHQQQQLKERIQQSGGAVSLQQAATWIKEQSGFTYCLSAVWKQLRRMGIKKKTGRPSHIHKDEQAVAAFKKKTFLL